jgi:hypothetical protein
MSAPLTLISQVPRVGVATDDQPVITGLACAEFDAEVLDKF